MFVYISETSKETSVKPGGITLSSSFFTRSKLSWMCGCVLPTRGVRMRPHSFVRAENLVFLHETMGRSSIPTLWPRPIMRGGQAVVDGPRRW